MMEIGRQILISNMEKEKTSGDFRKLFVLIQYEGEARGDQLLPVQVKVRGWKEVTSVTSGSEQHIYLAFATFCLGQVQCL